MAWQSYMTTIVRNIIDDVDPPQTYTDSRIEETIVVAAQLIYNELNFAQTYTINVDNLSISPDPTDLPDHAFLTLVALKAACLLVKAIYRQQARSAGIRLKDGPTDFSTEGSLKGYDVLLKQVYADFEKARWEYLTTRSVGKSILAPFSSPVLDFRGIDNYTHRDRMD